VITTVAETGTGASAATTAPPPAPSCTIPGESRGLCRLNLYIADTGNNRIRKVSNGVITTVAGNGTPGFGGDNGPATSANCRTPLASRWTPQAAFFIRRLQQLSASARSQTGRSSPSRETGRTASAATNGPACQRVHGDANGGLRGAWQPVPLSPPKPCAPFPATVYDRPFETFADAIVVEVGDERGCLRSPPRRQRGTTIRRWLRGRCRAEAWRAVSRDGGE